MPENETERMKAKHIFVTMSKVLTSLGVTILITACGLQTNPPTNGELVVFAASSLTNVFMELANEFEAQYPGTNVSLNFASSSQLAAQIMEGAQADIFASANQIQMTNIADASLTKGQPIIFAGNQLTVLVPKDNPANIQSLADLANPDITLILAAPATPIRVYSDQIIQQYARRQYTGQQYADAVYANLASEESNVRQVVTKIALGEGDAGFAYLSDLTPDIADYVLSIPIPPEDNITAEYPIATLSSSQNPNTAALFITFVLSPEGQAICSKWGFLPADTLTE